MKIGVLGGTGAMGSALGATWASQGHEVVLVDVNRAAVDKINEAGVVVQQKDGSSATVSLRASADPEAVGACDLVVVFVKCYHTEAAIKGAQALIGPETTVLSLQNGWGNGPKIAELLTQGRLLVGVTYHSATLVEPGVVLHAGVGPTHIGTLDGKPSEHASKLASELLGEKFPVVAAENVLFEIWKKLCLNLCTLSTSSLLRFGACELVEHEGTLQVMKSILTEAVAVAQAKGIPIDFDERWTTITELLGRVGKSKSSMLQDVEARRRTEIEVINGAIVAAGAEVGIPTPVNQAMVHLISALQETFI